MFGKRTWSSLCSIGGMDGQGRGLITDECWSLVRSFKFVKAGGDVFWIGLVCVFWSRNFSELVGKHIHHNFGPSSDQTTYSRAMSDCSFIFFRGGWGVNVASVSA